MFAREEALLFGTVLSVFSVLTLGLLVSWARRSTAGSDNRLLYLRLYDLAQAPNARRTSLSVGAAGALPGPWSAGAR